MNLSFSQLATWRRCRQRYAWWYHDRVRPERDSLGLVRGDAGHQALAAWLGGDSEEDALQAAHAALLTRAAPEQVPEAWRLLETVLRRYFAWSPTVDHWREECVATEYRLDQPLLDQHRIVGYIDGVLRRPDGDWLVEHKFVQNAETKHLLLDPQCTTYCLLYWRQTGVFPRGVIYNTVRMKDGPTARAEPAVRTVVTRTVPGAELAWQELLAESRELILHRRWLERGHRELLYRNATHDCHWDCDLYRHCVQKELTGREPWEQPAESASAGDLVLVP